MASVVKGSKIAWMLEIGRWVAHERPPDGSHIVHINPRGGTATLANDIRRTFSTSSFGRLLWSNLLGHLDRWKIHHLRS